MSEYAAPPGDPAAGSGRPVPVEPFARLGDSGLLVADIRGKLARLGLLVPVVDSSIPDPASRFDGDCDQAVRAFQQQRGLSVDGVVGPATYRALDEARWTLGDRILDRRITRLLNGDDVAALQRRLYELGFDPGRADGIFGEETEQAVRLFQRNVGLRADGTCGPGTFKALDRLSRTVVGGQASALRESEQIHAAGPRLPGKVVVIDPAHGGDDLGNYANGLAEAGVVFDLASRVEGRLAATGVRVYLTRGMDGGSDEFARAAFANSTGADVVVSIHVDAYRDARANGVASYYYGASGRGYSAAGQRFASLVQREIVARTDLLDDRIHPKTWDLLRHTRMPAVRLEVGYLTNVKDAARLADPGFRDTVAEAIVVAVQRLYLPSGEDAATGSLQVSELIP